MFEIELGNGIIFQVEDDEFITSAFHVRLKRDFDILSNLHLVPLFPRLANFAIGDYYQKSFTSYPAKNGYGRLLIETLLEHHAEAIPNCINIYSSSWIRANNFDETDSISVDAVAYWDSLVTRELAIRNEQMARYHLTMD